MSAIEVDNAVIFIGMPRSGTTVLFEAFARHRSLGWPSNYTEWFPDKLWMNGLRRLLDNRFIRLRGTKRQVGRSVPLSGYLVRPQEAYAFWDRYANPDFSRTWMRGRTAAPAERQRLLGAAADIVRWQGRTRFAAKLTGPPRLEYLSSLFGPQATYVHVIRDGRAVVDSLLRVAFWREQGGFEAPFWRDGPDTAGLEAIVRRGPDPAELTAAQWAQVVSGSRDERARLGIERYVEVRYEDFVDDPHGVLSSLYARCDLDDDADAHKALDRGPALRNMNEKFRARFDDEAVARLEAVMQPVLGELGYV